MFKRLKSKTPVEATVELENKATEFKKELLNISDYGERLKELQEGELTPSVVDAILFNLIKTHDSYRCISKLTGEIAEDMKIIIDDIEKMG